MVEVDGGQHWVPEHRNDDLRRDEVLRSLGLRVVRYSNSEVLKNLDSVMTDIRRWILEGLRARGDYRGRENPP